MSNSTKDPGPYGHLAEFREKNPNTREADASYYKRQAQRLAAEVQRLEARVAELYEKWLDENGRALDAEMELEVDRKKLQDTRRQVRTLEGRVAETTQLIEAMGDAAACTILYRALHGIDRAETP